MSRQGKIILGIVLLCGIVSLFLYLNGTLTFLSIRRNGVAEQLDIRKLWNAGDYITLTEFADNTLTENPLNTNALFYGGIAHFYIALATPSRQEQLNSLNLSIEYLRKILILSHPPQLAKIYYVLAQAYYHKGEFYYDVSVDYMQQSIRAGYVGEQSYEYLGAAHAKLSNYQESLDSFQVALSQGNRSNELLIAIAETHYLVEDYDSALETVTQLKNNEQSDSVQQQADLLFAKIYIADQQYDRAERILLDFLEKHPKSAEGHFLLGEYYNAVNILDRARFQWRTAFRLDPDHVEALQSLRAQ